MLPWSLLALAVVGLQGLELAPGQQAMARSHEADFPKAAWVVAERMPVSGSPSLGGRLVAVFKRGDTIEIAGFAGQVPRAGAPGTVDDVLAIGVGHFGFRGAGYLRAADVAVYETALGHCCADTSLFSSVVGRSPSPDGAGMVLDLAVWARSGDAVPQLVLAVPNRAPGPRLLPGAAGAAGAAVEAAGRVAILNGRGDVVYRSPEHEGWTLKDATPGGFVLEGPRGLVTLDAGGRPVR